MENRNSVIFGCKTSAHLKESMGLLFFILFLSHVIDVPPLKTCILSDCLHPIIFDRWILDSVVVVVSLTSTDAKSYGSFTVIKKSDESPSRHHSTPFLFNISRGRTSLTCLRGQFRCFSPTWLLYRIYGYSGGISVSQRKDKEMR